VIRILDYSLYKKRFAHLLTIFMLLPLVFVASSCQEVPSQDGGEGLKILATTSLVGDVVSQVGGEKISPTVLLPLGTDPHSFSPTPRQASEIVDADIIFANGAGLEEFLNPLLENVGGSAQVIEVSQGIKLRSMHDEDSSGEQLVDDPHTWMDPNNVLIWVDNIVQSLSAKDPANADYYHQNGEAYKAKLRELDGWIESEVSTIPVENRKLVTEHLVFGYFADRYGFDQVGAIIPGFSSLAEPSAQDIAQIEAEITTLHVKAIMLNFGENAGLAERISADTATSLAYLYMHSLSEPGGVAANYLDFMRHDVTSIAEALK